MRFLKILVIASLLLGIAKYFPVIYYTQQFNEFVVKESARTKKISQLRQALYDHAAELFIPLQPSDVEIKENGPDFKVSVNYEVPVNLFVYTHRLAFHAAAAGTIPDSN